MEDYIKVNIENTKKLMKNINPQRYKELKVNRYIPTIKLMEKYIDKNSPLLDIGIREGAFLKVLRGEGFTDLNGVDIYKDGVDQGNKEGFKCEISDAMNLDLGRTFDIITISHVIEHCPDINKVINNIDNHLNMNGVLYVEVPKEKKQKVPTKNGHYFCFSTLKELHSFFPKSKWKMLELCKNDRGKRLKILVRKIK